MLFGYLLLLYIVLQLKNENVKKTVAGCLYVCICGAAGLCVNFVQAALVDRENYVHAGSCIHKQTPTHMISFFSLPEMNSTCSM